MADLLTVMPVSQKAFKKGTSPIAMEFQVDQALHPYLVTAAGKSKFIWLTRAPQGRVRAAFRKQGRENLFLDIIKEVSLCGRENLWDNVFDYSPVGLTKAVERVQYYGIQEVDLLVPTGDFSDFEIPGVRLVETPWLPVGFAVAVPRDRNSLGFVADLPSGDFISVVHNPSRGIALAVRDEYR